MAYHPPCKSFHLPGGGNGGGFCVDRLFLGVHGRARLGLCSGTEAKACRQLAACPCVDCSCGVLLSGIFAGRSNCNVGVHCVLYLSCRTALCLRAHRLASEAWRTRPPVGLIAERFDGEHPEGEGSGVDVGSTTLCDPVPGIVPELVLQGCIDGPRSGSLGLDRFRHSLAANRRDTGLGRCFRGASDDALAQGTAAVDVCD
jgi:hypothetical protein